MCLLFSVVLEKKGPRYLEEEKIIRINGLEPIIFFIMFIKPSLLCGPVKTVKPVATARTVKINNIKGRGGLKRTRKLQ